MFRARSFLWVCGMGKDGEVFLFVSYNSCGGLLCVKLTRHLPAPPLWGRNAPSRALCGLCRRCFVIQKTQPGGLYPHFSAKERSARSLACRPATMGTQTPCVWLFPSELVAVLGCGLSRPSRFGESQFRQVSSRAFPCVAELPP